MTATKPIVDTPARMTGTMVFLLCTICATALVPSSQYRAFVRNPSSTPVSQIRQRWIPGRGGLVRETFLSSSTSSSWNAPSYSNYTDHVLSNENSNYEAALAEQSEKDKKAMIRKLLMGYNAKTASALKNSEVKRQTMFWSTQSGVVGQYFGDELYHDVLGVSISRATTMIDCLADMWQFINDIILDYKEVEFIECTNEAEEEVLAAQHRWALWRKDPSDDRPLEGSKHAYFCTFTQCPDAYDYKAFTALVASLEFCRDLCAHMGNEFTITLFHPKFKNSPTLLSPERHSPFPTIALQFGPAFKEEELAAETSIFTRKKREISYDQHEQQLSDKSGDEKKGPATAEMTDEDDEEDDQNTIDPNSSESTSRTAAEDEIEQVFADLIEGTIDDLDYTRSRLEVLYNTAAASGLYDAVWTHPSFDGDEFDELTTSTVAMTQSATTIRPSFGMTASKLSTDEELLWLTANIEAADLPLAKSFQQERKRRRKDVPVKCVRQYSSDWANGARRVQEKVNPALLYWDSILNDENQPDGWVICQENLPEHVYSSLWNAIRELYVVGRQADQEVARNAAPTATPVPETTPDDQRRLGGGSRFNLAAWQSSLSAPREAAATTSSNAEPAAQQDVSAEEAAAISDISPKNVRSRLFVTTKFMPYNAEGFKRFAVTVNAALKRFTDNRMFIEVFHPEYVGSKGYQHDLRRAPFPMIQICYHVQPDSSTMN